MIPDIKYRLLIHLCRGRLCNDTALAYLLPSTSISTLHIPRSAITDQGLRTIAKYCGSTLQELSISGCEACTTDGVLAIAQACGANLKQLDVSHCKDISTKGRSFDMESLYKLFAGLVTALQYLPNLLSLSMRYCIINFKGMSSTLLCRL